MTKVVMNGTSLGKFGSQLLINVAHNCCNHAFKFLHVRLGSICTHECAHIALLTWKPKCQPICLQWFKGFWRWGQHHLPSLKEIQNRFPSSKGVSKQALIGDRGRGTKYVCNFQIQLVWCVVLNFYFHIIHQRWHLLIICVQYVFQTEFVDLWNSMSTRINSQKWLKWTKVFEPLKKVWRRQVNCTFNLNWEVWTSQDATSAATSLSNNVSCFCLGAVGPEHCTVIGPCVETLRQTFVDTSTGGPTKSAVRCSH